MTASKKSNGAAAKPKGSRQQRKLRLQQIVMAVIGLVVILSMVLALILTY